MPNRIRRVAIFVAGIMVLMMGAVMIPYPGPGWLVVFMGLAVLAKEFPWAERSLRYGRTQYSRWNRWVRRQHWSVKTLTVVLTCLVVVITVWLVNGYGLLNLWFHLGVHWLSSPFVR